MVDCLLITPEKEIKVLTFNTDKELESKITKYITPYYGKIRAKFEENILILSSNLLEGKENKIAKILINKDNYQIKGNVILIFKNKWTERLYNIPNNIIEEIERIKEKEFDSQILKIFGEGEQKCSPEEFSIELEKLENLYKNIKNKLKS